MQNIAFFYFCSNGEIKTNCIQNIHRKSSSDKNRNANFCKKLFICMYCKIGFTSVRFLDLPQKFSILHHIFYLIIVLCIHASSFVWNHGLRTLKEKIAFLHCTLNSLVMLGLMKFIHVENMVVSLIFFIRGLNQMIFWYMQKFPNPGVQIQWAQSEQISAFNFCMGCRDGFNVFKFPDKKKLKTTNMLQACIQQVQSSTVFRGDAEGARAPPEFHQKN